MGSYTGPAQLVIAGATHPTTATLHAAHPHWYGSLDLDGSVAWEAFNAAELPTLRLPDGREGRVLVAADGTVKGSGPPPFDA